MSPSRRGLLAAGLALVAAPALASPRTASAWIAYEGRLRARLGDAGGGRFHAGIAQGLHDLTNRARRRAGAPAVAWHEGLARAARAHAADLAQRVYVEHLSPEGFDPTDRLGLVARRLLCTAAENIAYRRGDAPHSAVDLMEQWRGSPPHWANLLRDRHTHVGYGVVQREERTYAVGLYGAPDGELAADLPFRLREPREVLAAFEGLGKPFIGVWLADELNDGARAPLTNGTLLKAGVYRVRVDRRVRDGVYTSAFGPVIAWGGAG
ncbi:CAP domain-containing protein [Phenylobacterium sp.]|uniref:CAP domain-containing protein n=1 Tax=Phenylobacterium sp. TaxID=1871053 RepID=UPI002F92DE62